MHNGAELQKNNTKVPSHTSSPTLPPTYNSGENDSEGEELKERQSGNHKIMFHEKKKKRILKEDLEANRKEQLGNTEKTVSVLKLIKNNTLSKKTNS